MYKARDITSMQKDKINRYKAGLIGELKVNSKRKDGKVKRHSKRKMFVFHLFVAGMSPKSLEAISKLEALFKQSFIGDFEFKVTDIYQTPKVAKTEGVIAVPTLIKKLPPPIRRFIGDMPNTKRVLLGLDIKT